MSEKAIVCDDCFNFLAKEGASFAHIWAGMCDIHTNQGLFLYRACDDKILAFLETRGFIVSTEKGNMLIVKVLGQKNDGKMTYYCPRCCDG